MIGDEPDPCEGPRLEPFATLGRGTEGVVVTCGLEGGAFGSGCSPNGVVLELLLGIFCCPRPGSNGGSGGCDGGTGVSIEVSSKSWSISSIGGSRVDDGIAVEIGGSPGGGIHG